MAQPYKAKTILRLGAFQSGKTSGAVQTAYNYAVADPKLINVFIAYNTNINKSNQELHIQNIFGNKVNLINKETEMAVFLACTEKRINCFENNYPIVISCLDHFKHLETLLTLVALDSEYKFDIYVDESDSMALAHERKKSDARKDNLVNSLISQKCVRNFVCLTATPFSEIASNMDWDEIEPVVPGDTYNPIDASPTVPCPKDAMSEFNLGRITPTIEDFLLSQSKQLNTVTLVSTQQGINLHHQQAESISAFLPSNCLTVVLNSSARQKYYVKGKPTYVPTKRNREGQLEELFEVAENYDKLFIVGYDMLSRSVTLKKGKFNSFSGMIFSATESTHLAVMLQRVARIAGYQNYPAVLMTDKTILLKGALLQYPILLEVAIKYKKANERLAALLAEVPNFFPNIFGEKDNAIKRKTSSRTKCMSLTTEAEAKKAKFQVLSTLIQIKAEDIPETILECLKQGKKATVGTPLHEFIQEQHFSSNRILEADKGRHAMALPNAEVDDNYRDTLYLFEKNRLKILVQPFSKIRDNIRYAVHNLLTNELDCYAPKGNFRV